MRCPDTWLSRGCGIEPNQEYCKKAKSTGLSVENCTIEDYDPGIRFDVITMTNALEHVLSPTEVLTKINNLLNDEGHVLVSVPNVYNRTINLPIDAFLSNAHIYHFSIITLCSLFNKCGFEVVENYCVTEEMGDKIYLLGKKADIGFELPIMNGHEIELTKKHFETSDKVFQMKLAIQQAGFK